MYISNTSLNDAPVACGKFKAKVPLDFFSPKQVKKMFKFPVLLLVCFCLILFTAVSEVNNVLTLDENDGPFNYHQQQDDLFLTHFTDEEQASTNFDHESELYILFVSILILE